jgi:hypothetical protein
MNQRDRAAGTAEKKKMKISYTNFKKPALKANR